MTDDKRHRKAITERIEYLTDKIAICSDKAKSHHQRERAALVWLLAAKGDDQAATADVDAGAGYYLAMP